MSTWKGKRSTGHVKERRRRRPPEELSIHGLKSRIAKGKARGKDMSADEQCLRVKLEEKFRQEQKGLEIPADPLAAFAIPAAPVAPPGTPPEQVAILERIRILERAEKIARARESLRHFLELGHPDPEFPDSVTHTTYKVLPHHNVLIGAMEKVERKELMRSAYSVPPQTGKTTIIAQFGIAWIWGRKPWLRIIVGTYSDDRAAEVGDAVREIVRADWFRQVFPKCVLREDKQAVDGFKNTAGGSVIFRGRGSGTTGQPCDLFIIDDPIKDDKEARSATILEDVKKWYSKVVFTRCPVLTPIMVVQTRWCDDDLIGWLCDPDHPANKANPERLRRWRYINIPAIVDTPDLAQALGVELGSALWPERFPLEHLAEARINDPQGFSAMYMGRPAPDDGEFFRAKDFVEYGPGELPSRLRYYAASDHAVKADQRNDLTCLLPVGVDQHNCIWILPDVVWKRMDTHQTVEEMLGLMQKFRFLLWWAESGHISGSILPFLRRRMLETKTYITIDEQPPRGDKKSRAQSFQARMSMGMVRWPGFAPWYADARRELLRFDAGTHDDFVDACGHLGMGLDRQVRARHDDAPDVRGTKVLTPRVGSLAWTKWAHSREKRLAEHDKRVRNL